MRAARGLPRPFWRSGNLPEADAVRSGTVDASLPGTPVTQLLRRKLFVVAAALAATACLSPTLPLPPPSDPKQSELDETTGTLHLTGHVPASSWVYALNERTNRGYIQITASDGLYDLTVEAVHGDSFALWYQLEGESSQPLYIDIK